MASKAYPNVYLEGVEVPEDTGEEPNQVWHQAVLGVYVGQCEQRILGSRRKRYNAASGTHMQPSQSRLSLPNGLLCSIAQNVRNRRMPNGTYGGVRGRKTKVGRKLSFSSYSMQDPQARNLLDGAEGLRRRAAVALKQYNVKRG